MQFHGLRRTVGDDESNMFTYLLLYLVRIINTSCSHTATRWKHHSIAVNARSQFCAI